MGRMTSHMKWKIENVWNHQPDYVQNLLKWRWLNFEDSECVAVKTNDVGKIIIKPPICEWFIHPIYGDLGKGFMALFYPHTSSRDIGPGDFKHNLMNIYHPKGMSIGPARIWDSGFLPAAKSTSCYPFAGMIVVPQKGCFNQPKPSVLRGLLHGPGMGLKFCTQKNGDWPTAEVLPTANWKFTSQALGSNFGSAKWNAWSPRKINDRDSETTADWNNKLEGFHKKENVVESTIIWWLRHTSNS